MRLRAFSIRPEHARELLEEAIREYAFYVNVDHLPLGSMRRKETDKSIGWVMNYILESKHRHFAFIEREVFDREDCVDYFDVGCSTVAARPDYFLWIKVPIEAGEKLIEKYQLEQLQ